MKKIITIFTLLLLISLTACGTKGETATLLYEETGIHMEYEINAKEDVVYKITQTTTLDLSAYTEDQLNQFTSGMDSYKSMYEAIEGITYETELGEDSFVEKIILDTTKEETLTMLSEQNLMSIEGDGSISLKKTVESLKEQGWIEK